MNRPAITKATLSDLCIKVTDGTHDSPRLLSEGMPFIKGKHISQGYIDFANCDFISRQDHLKVIERSKPERGDILFANIGNSLGDTVFVDTDMEFSIKNVALFKPDPAKIDPRYLFYIVVNDSFQETIKAKRSGSAQPFVGLDTLRGHEVKYHVSLTVQRKIASILSAYDDLIKNNTRRIEILEEMARSIYTEWFVNFRFPGHENVKMVDSGLGPIPEGWEVKKLKDVVDLLYGKALKAENRLEGAVPVYGSSGIVGYHNISLVTGPGIIVGRKGNVGSVNWSSTDFFPIDTVFYIKSSLSLHYLYYALQNLNFVNNDAAVPGLSRDQAYSKLLLVPGLRIQSLFTDVMNPMFRLVEKLRMICGNLRRTRDQLLPRLVAGELDVSQIAIREVV